MALRRLASGLSGGLETIFALLLQDRMLGKRQQAGQQSTRLNQLLDDVRAQLKTFTPERAQAVGPEALEAEFENLMGTVPEDLRGAFQKPNFSRLQPPAETRMGLARRKLETAETPGEIPGEAGLKGLLSEAGIAPTREEPGSFTRGIGLGTREVPTDELQQLLSEAGERRTALSRELPREPVDYFDETGNALRSFLTEEQQGGLGGVRRERTDEQEAARQGSIRGATAQSEADVAHAPVNIQGAARRAGAVTGAETGARLGQEKAFGAGSFRPEISTVEDVDAQGNKRARFMQIQPQSGQVSEVGDVQTGVPSEQLTDGMRQSWDYANRSVAAHGILARLEPVLAQRNLVVSLAQVNALPETITDPVVRQYAQAAREFINAQARRESGAAISEVEYGRYIRTSGWKPGDDPQTLQQKQDTRRRTIQGLVQQTGNRLGGMFVPLEELKQLPSAAGKSDAQLKQEAEAAGYRVY